MPLQMYCAIMRLPPRSAGGRARARGRPPCPSSRALVPRLVAEEEAAAVAVALEVATANGAVVVGGDLQRIRQLLAAERLHGFECTDQGVPRQVAARRLEPRDEVARRGIALRGPDDRRVAR